jgi:hypothetical protein
VEAGGQWIYLFDIVTARTLDIFPNAMGMHLSLCFGISFHFKIFLLPAELFLIQCKGWG